MNEGRVAIYLRDVMKEVRTTLRGVLIYGADGLWAAAQQRPDPGPMACPQTSGHIGAALQ